MNQLIKMMHLTNVLILVIPSIAMISGLSAASTISIFLITMFWQVRKELTINVTDHKSELAFCLWCLVSLCWAPHFWQGFKLLILVSLVIIAGLFLIKYFKQGNRSDLEKYFLIGIALAIGVFFIEYFSNGYLTLEARKIFQLNSSKPFTMDLLDRGCALLSTLSWVVIGILCNKYYYLRALVFFILQIILLAVSDSLSSFVAFLVSGVVFLMLCLTRMKLAKLIILGFVFGCAAMPVFSYKIKPYEIVDSSLHLPPSSKHRLFIWNYVAKKILERPVIGFGFNSSRFIEPKAEEYINYQEYNWSPLPVHPHNIIMQVLLELGVIGWIIFTMVGYKLFSQINKKALIDNDFYWGAASFACLTNYLIIGLISFGVWQLWWVCTAMFAAVLMRLLVKKDGEINGPQLNSNRL